MNLFEIPVRRLVVVLAAAAAAVALAACGSSSTTSTNKPAAADSPTTSTTASGSSFNRSQFVSCLKKHGVTLPSRPAGAGGAPPGGGGAPPDGGGAPPGGGFFGGSGSGGGFRGNPKDAAAFKACGGGNFRFRGGARGRFRISHTAIDKYVACVRQHGYPQMPNANFSGKGPVFPSSIRANKQFQSASRSCESLLVQPRPSGTGGASTNPSS